MYCKTGRSNPPSEISWVVDGRPINAHNNVTPDAAGGFVTTADITVSITNQDRSMKMFSCYAVNQALGETVVETSVLSVLCEYRVPRLHPDDKWRATTRPSGASFSPRKREQAYVTRVMSLIRFLVSRLVISLVRGNRSSRLSLYFWIPGKHGNQSGYTSTPDLRRQWREPDPDAQVVRS